VKIQDVRDLWGRAANRCSICHIDLAPSGRVSTIGEMAHIVAKSPKKARGAETPPGGEIDAYGNLILLCPNDHTIIDDDPEGWPVDKLVEVKKAHEQWVNTRLEAGTLSLPRPVDNTAFLANRRAIWENDETYPGSWCVMSFTPLDTQVEVYEPSHKEFAVAVGQINLGFGRYDEDRLGVHGSLPTLDGFTNSRVEDLSELGIGWRLYANRCGHIELASCMKGRISGVTSSFDGIPNDLLVLHYLDLAGGIEKSFSGLRDICESFGMPQVGTFTVCLTNMSRCALYASKGRWGQETVHETDRPILDYHEVVNIREEADPILERALARLSQGFGLVLDKLRDEDGDFERPHRMM
jgi:hypothetical protein